MNNNYSKNIVSTYYQALAERNFEIVEQLIHPECVFIGPLDERSGRDSILESVKGFASTFERLILRYTFGEGDTGIAFYDAFMPEPVGKIRGAVLIAIENNMIKSFELFYDASKVIALQQQIFKK